MLMNCDMWLHLFTDTFIQPTLMLLNASMAFARGEGLYRGELDFLPELRECLTEYIECRAERYILMVGCILLMVMALVGNSLTLSVMLRPKLRYTATAVFISTLATTDTIANITGLTRHFTIKAFNVDVRQLSPLSCSIHKFILFLALDTSSWLLAVITIERFLAVCLPQKHKSFKSARLAFKIIALLILIQIAFNMHVLWSRGRHWENPDNKNITSEDILNCGYTSQNSRYFWSVHQGWISLVWYGLIPFSVMLILNIFIVRRLYQLKKSSIQRGPSQISTSSSVVTKQANSMTVMLLSVTFYFMVITTPVFIFTMCQSLLFYNGEVDEHALAKIELGDAIVTLFLYLNHSINFFLYCLAGRRFRKELKVMCGCLSTFRKISVRKAPAAKPEDRNELKPDYLALVGDNSKQQRSEVNETASVNISGL